MRKTLEILCILVVFTTVLSGCAGGNGDEKEEQPPVNESTIIKEVHVNEQPLSEINTSITFAN